MPDIKQLLPDNKILAAFAESRIGGRAENQDNFGAAETKRGYVVTVCDGMGGGPGGKTASTIAVKTIIDSIQAADEKTDTAKVLVQAIQEANKAIYERGNVEPMLRGMGSTATVVLINEHSAFAAHVGDSRIYQLRGKKKVFRTFDHSMVFELVKQKVITEEQARLSAESNIITRAMGIRPTVEVDCVELPYEKGDRFVLCSDGIHGTMPEPELINMLAANEKSLGVLVDKIATDVDTLGRKEGGGHDNLTIAIVETKINSKLTPNMSKKTKLMMTVLGIVCVLSLVANAFFLSKGLGPSDEELKAKVTCLKDSIAKQDSTIQTVKKEKEDTINLLNKKLSRSEKFVADDAGKIVNSNGVNALYRKYKETIDTIK